MNNYLTVAAKILREARQPLSARQILRAAYQLSIVPEGLYGKTQHKTLHARLAEDIVRHRNKSVFIRTEPGRFFLRDFLNDKTVPPQYKREYIAPLRVDQLRNFYVLCASRQLLERTQRKYGSLVALDNVDSFPCKYEALASMGADRNTFYVRVFIVIQNEHQFLLRRARSSFGDPISGQLSAGLIGFVKREDKSLFSSDRYGIKDAALRTMAEQLYLPQEELERFAQLGTSTPMHLIVDVSNEELQKAVAAIVLYHCPPKTNPIEHLSSNDEFRWYPRSAKVNNLDQFDPWSRYLLSSNLMTDAFGPLEPTERQTSR